MGYYPKKGGNFSDLKNEEKNIPVGDTSPRARVCIIGGGFGGVSAYRALRACRKEGVDITLVSGDEMFVHVPLLHEVATGALPEDIVAWPLAEYVSCPKTALIHGRAVSIDVSAGEIVVETNGMRTILSFDYAILATGSVPSAPDISGANKHVFFLRTLADAVRLREHLRACFEKARAVGDAKERKKLLTFVCIGAGVTGIELAGELSVLVADEFAGKYPDVYKESRVMLLNKAPHIVVGGDPWMSRKAEERLARLPQIIVRNNVSVTAVSEDGIMTAKGGIPSQTVVWTGGVLGNTAPLIPEDSAACDDRGRLMVTPELCLPKYRQVFVVGDAAHVPKPDGGSYGMQAQFAVRQGRHAAKNILRALRGKNALPFTAKPKGFLLPIGKHYGVAEVLGFRFSGRVAWHIAHVLYVLSVVGWRRRARVAWLWLYHLMRQRTVTQRHNNV